MIIGLARTWAAAMVLVALWVERAPGQTGAAAPTAGMTPVLNYLFEGFPSFSAKAEVELSGASTNDTTIMPMRFYFHQGATRTELDMSDVKGPALDAETAHTLRQIGMSEVITILQPDRQRNLVLYPVRKAYVATVDHSAEALKKLHRSSPRKTKLGEETVLGITCAKYEIALDDKGSEPWKVYVWEAPPQRHFPIQIMMRQGPGAMRVRYRDVTFATPSQGLFEIPEGYRQHEAVSSILQEASQELLNPQRPAP